MCVCVKETETTTVSVLSTRVLFPLVTIHREFVCLTGSSTWEGHFHLIFEQPEATCATDIHNLVLLNPFCKLKY